MNKCKKSKFALGNLIAFAIYVFAGIALGVAVNMDHLFNNGFMLGFCLFMLLLVSAFLLNLFIHELGHMVFGLLSGYKFVSFRVGSFTLVKSNGKYSLKRYSLAGTGGQCLMSPPGDMGNDTPVTLYNLGGSLLNIIVGSVLLIVSFFTMQYEIVTIILRTVSIVGFAVALINGIPMKLALLNNDGYNAFSLRKDDSARRAFWLTLKMNEHITNGARLKDMPDEWFVLPDEKGMQNSQTASLAVNASCRLMDQHRFTEADELMEQLLNSNNAILPIHRNLMIGDRIYCEIISDNRGTVIDEMRTKEIKAFMRSMSKHISVARTLYLCALLTDRNYAEAEKYRKNFEKIAKNHPYSGDLASERELIELAKNKVE